MSAQFEDELWQRAIDHAGLSAHSQILRREALPCYWTDAPVRDRYCKTGNTRFGGEPDLPRGFVWPVTHDGYMTFLAQINLSELPPDHVPDLPGEGWLYFFLGAGRAEFDLPHRVLYHAGPASDLARTRPPQGVSPVDAGRRFTPHQIRFFPLLTLPAESPAWEESGIENHPWYMVTQGETQLGGHAVTLAYNPAENAYLSRNGFGSLVGLAVESLALLDRTRERLRRDLERERGAGQDIRPLEQSLAALDRYRQDFERHRRAIAGWRLLLILASDESIGMSWGDNGLLQFIILESDLQARRFENTYCELYST